MIKQHILWAALAVVTACSVFSCKPYDDSDDPGVIVDEQGVTIELSWTNTATDPYEKTDLVLHIDEGGNTLFSTAGWNNDHQIELEKGSLNDGTYQCNVIIYDIDRPTNYKIKVTGKSTGKAFVAEYGPVNANDLFTTLYPLTLTVTGTKYKFVR